MQSIINNDTRDALCEIKLIDIIATTTYTNSDVVAPMESWITDTYTWLKTTFAVGFGWGYVISTGSPGTMYAWGAIYGTVSGRITGLSVVMPSSGF